MLGNESNLTEWNGCLRFTESFTELSGSVVHELIEAVTHEAWPKRFQKAFTINRRPAWLDLVKISGTIPVVVMQGSVHRTEFALKLYFTLHLMSSSACRFERWLQIMCSFLREDDQLKFSQLRVTLCVIWQADVNILILFFNMIGHHWNAVGL